MNKTFLKTLLAPALLSGLCLLSTPAFVGAAPLTLHADSSLVYQVQGRAPGQVLKMYKNPGSGIIVNLPHNARWVIRRGAQETVGGTLWEKVSWGQDQTGWVESNYLKYDADATRIARERRECMQNPAVKDKMCCGYPEAAKGVPFRSVPIFSVTGLKPGESLIMYKEQSESAIAVEIPHNATWVTKMGKVAEGGDVSFELVRWAGQNGWVNSKFLRLDPEKTREGDAKRRRCSGGQELLPPARSDVVCLPASVIRRLREAGALPDTVIDQLAKQPN